MVLARHQKDLLQLQPRLDILTARLGTSRLGEHLWNPQLGTAISHVVEYQVGSEITLFRSIFKHFFL